MTTAGGKWGGGSLKTRGGRDRGTMGGMFVTGGIEGGGKTAGYEGIEP